MTEQQNEVTPSKMTRDQLKVIALRQRIGEITSNYEEMIADMRASFTEQTQEFQAALQSQFEQINTLTREKADLEALQQDEDKPAN